MIKTKKAATHSARKKPVAKKTNATKATAGKRVVKKAVVKKVLAKKSPKMAARKSPAGVPEIMRDEALKILSDRQGEEVVTIDLTGKSSVADYLIVASGRSARQIAAIAHYLREAFTKHGVKHVRVEGLPEGNWALVDGGDVIVHLFRPEVRSYYDLESIWDRKAGSGKAT